MRIGVIGTGVAGSVFLEALSRGRGFDTRAFDLVRPGAREEAGTGLNVGPNALKALRLHLPARHHALRAASLPWRHWHVALTDGTPLMDLDLLELAEETGIRIRWAQLYRVLRDPVVPLTTYDRALEALEEDGAGRLVPVFRDEAGGLHRDGAFDLLVAADGRYSRLRALLEGVPEPNFPGIGTWRLLVPPGGGPIGEYGQYFQGDYFQGNARLLSFRLPDEYVYIAGSFPLPGQGRIPPETQSFAAQRAWFLPQTGQPSEKVAWMLETLEQHMEALHWARTQDIPPLHRSRDNRVLFLGDAAHAVVQTLGQGATQAIEDEIAAAALLQTHGNDLTSFLDAYKSRRAARIAFVRDFSLEATDTLLPGNDPVAGTLKKTQAPFREKLRRLYTDVA